MKTCRLRGWPCWNEAKGLLANRANRFDAPSPGRCSQGVTLNARKAATSHVPFQTFRTSKRVPTVNGDFRTYDDENGGVYVRTFVDLPFI